MGKSTLFWEQNEIKRKQLETVQINLGNKCNLQCTHCHIGASPSGEKNMCRDVAEKLIKKLKEIKIENIEFTGGAPELNPNLEYFIEELSDLKRDLTIRTNLTVLEMPGYNHYFELFRKYRIKIISSLPAVFADVTDRQRGKGVFDKSIKVLGRLNELGYGRDGYVLDLVYNPESDYLPPDQRELQNTFKKQLKEVYNIEFNNLITIVNVPIKRYRSFLKKEDRLSGYIEILKNGYNPTTLNGLMCRSLISVDYQGDVYDCDFNLSLNKRVAGYENKKFWEIDFNNFNTDISFFEHCYACTVNRGSGCYGAIVNDERSSETSEKPFNIKSQMKNCYGEKLQSSGNLKTDACCTQEEIPEHVKKCTQPYS